MNEIGRKIADKIIEIHGSTDFKIAFLPYKRSMWNSMESVYEELLTSGVDAHCVPIPYIRMKMNYQIDRIDSDFELFGGFAESTMALEKMDPDYVVIHYQYENNNLVTKMLPEYHTRAIKRRLKCKVIFIPYGYCLGPENRQFVIQPGLREVDYAFVEAEENVQPFIEEWKSFGIDFTGRVWGLGSPKLDSFQKIHEEIPEEWLGKVDSRSISLVTTSLGPFLSDSDGRIEAYKKAVNKEIDNGNAVIFRPHPLLRTTINSMRPEKLGDYISMMIEFRDMDHVIVDESEFLERAVGISDRLVSDVSSLIPMWQQTGKPFRII